MRNAMAHVGKGQRTMVVALLRTVLAQDSGAECHQQWRLVPDQLRENYPKIAALMGGCEDEVLAHMAIPKVHRQQPHSTYPLVWLNAEIKCRTDVVGIFPPIRP
jgi:putative transposase